MDTFGVYGHVVISIHAPRTGSDAQSSDCGGGHDDFNPRSPHGERHGTPRLTSAGRDFNPRSPHGERQVCADKP